MNEKEVRTGLTRYWSRISFEDGYGFEVNTRAHLHHTRALITTIETFPVPGQLSYVPWIRVTGIPEFKEEPEVILEFPAERMSWGEPAATGEEDVLSTD